MAEESERAHAIFSAPLPNKFPPDSVIAVVREGCELCKQFLEASHYPEKTESGKPIVYVPMHDNDKAATAYYMHTLAGHADGKGQLPLIFSVDAKGHVGHLLASGPDAALKNLFPKAAATLHAGHALAACGMDVHPQNGAEAASPLPALPARPDKCSVPSR